MGTLRILFRLPLFFLVTAFLGLLSIAGSCIIERFSSKAAFWYRARFVQTWAWSIGWILGMRLTIEGSAPSPPFHLVTNHLSYVDIVLLCRICPAYFVSRADVKHWPFLGPIIHHGSNILFIDRSSRKDVLRVGEKMDAHVQDGHSVVFFPEATSTNGADVVPFKPSLLQLAANRDDDVHYGCIYYETRPGDPPASDCVCWWGDAEFFPHFIALLKLKRFNARIRFGENPIQNSDRKMLASQLREAILQLFEPLTKG